MINAPQASPSFDHWCYTLSPSLLVWISDQGKDLSGIRFEELYISSYTSRNFNQCGDLPGKNNSSYQKGKRQIPPIFQVKR